MLLGVLIKLGPIRGGKISIAHRARAGRCAASLLVMGESEGWVWSIKAQRHDKKNRNEKITGVCEC